MFLSARSEFAVTLCRYNAIKTYWNGNGETVLSAPMHMVAAAEAGKHIRLIHIPLINSDSCYHVSTKCSAT